MASNFQVRVGASLRYSYFPTNEPNPVSTPIGDPMPMPENGQVIVTSSDASILSVVPDNPPSTGMASGYFVGVAPGSVTVTFHWLDGAQNVVLPDMEDFIDVVAADQPAIYVFLQPVASS